MKTRRNLFAIHIQEPVINNDAIIDLKQQGKDCFAINRL